MAEQGFYDGAYGLKSQREARDLYTAWAATYDDELLALDYAQPQRAAAAMAQVLPDRSSSILDVGCGTGLAGRALHELGYTDLHGRDFSPEMLEQAEATDIYRSLAEVDLNLPLAAADDSHDAVSAVGCFSFGHIDVGALDELVRVVRPGGALVVAVNAPYYDEGDLPAKLDAMAASGVIDIVIREQGAHMPAHDVEGWVIAATVA